MEKVVKQSIGTSSVGNRIRFLTYPLFVEKNVHLLSRVDPRAEIDPATVSVVGPRGKIRGAFGNVFH